MFKRILYGGVFALVCAGLVLVILLQRMDKITPVEALQAVPGDAILFVEEVDYEYISETFIPHNRIWIDFVNTTGRTGIDSAINRLIIRISDNEALGEILLKEGLSISIHLQGKDQLVPVIYIPYAGYYGDHEFEQQMLSLLSAETLVNERKYEAETLYDISGNPGYLPGKLTFCCIDGLCLFSPSSLLVENAVRTIHAGTGQEGDQGLQLVRGTAGRYVHANIYIRYSRVHQLLYPLIREKHWSLLNSLAMLATWGELDLDIKEDAMVLNGMTLAEGDAPLFLGAFTGQSPVKMELHEMMPSGTSSFMHMGISDRAAFREEMEDYIMRTGERDMVKMERERLEREYGIDPLGDLFRIMDDEMTWFALEDGTQDPGNEVILVETRSQSETEEVVVRWIEQYLKVQVFDMESYRHLYRLDNQTSFPVYRLPELFYDGTLPGRLFNTHFAVYEGCLIFGPSVDAISRVIYQNILHKTFVTDPLFKEISDYLANRSNLTFYFRPYTYLDHRRELIEESDYKKIEAMELFLRRIPGIVVQYSSEDRLLYHSISCKYTSQIREKALTVWESLMDSSVINKPALVINHHTRENEIFIQDASNKIYLINSTGRILWEQMIEGPIMGSVRQVDFYKNGKLQLLFNTAQKVHLIDRNGNYVERYPIILRSEATAPMALFDYDKSRDYRIFLPATDRKVYVYDIEGKLVTGWKFGKSESVVTTSPQHFRISDRDYILFFDGNRPYILDRRGRERIKPGERIVFSPGNPFTLDMNIREEKPRWISTDTAGCIRCIYLDGSVSTLLDRESGPGHFFRMQDLDMDGVPEYILAHDNELTVLHQDGKRLFSYRVKDRISGAPDIYKFSASDIKIGLTDQSRNRIYLINSDGSLYEGFPLEGSTRFSIGYFAGSDSRFNLLVGSANNFLYNYSIE